jgi:acyl-CoA thioester hydrolase
VVVTPERNLTLAGFPVVRDVATRWSDNDVFGHLNNAVYYEIFDTAINGWLGDALGTDPTALPAMGVVAESGCRFFEGVEFPQRLQVGLAVTRLGSTSVTYQLAVFADPTGAPPAAVGHWVHVYVDPDTRRPVTIPPSIRQALSKAVVPARDDT